MSETRRLVKKKRVNVRCARPFRIGLTPFSGFCQKIILNVEDILQCIANKSFVEEVLKNGDVVKLNFSNYNTYNGPTDVEDDSIEVTDIENANSDIEIIKRDANGNIISINQNKPKEKREIRVLNRSSSDDNKKQTTANEKKTEEIAKNIETKEDKNPLEEISKDIDSSIVIKEDKNITVKKDDNNKEETISTDDKDKEKNNNKNDKKFDYNQQPSNFNKKKNKY